MKKLVAFILLMSSMVLYGGSPFRSQVNAYLDAVGDPGAYWEAYATVGGFGFDTWRSSAPPPTPADLSDPAVLSLPKKYRKVVGVKWVEKTQAEKDAVDAAEQAAKSAKLKSAENKMIDFMKSESIITNETHLTEAHIDLFYDTVDALPGNAADASFNKYDRLLRNIERKGGNLNDIHEHP